MTASDLARLWVRITGLIFDVTLSPPLEEMVADFRSAELDDQRFFLIHTERCLQKAYMKLQRNA